MRRETGGNQATLPAHGGLASLATDLLPDPCRLARQVKQFARLEHRSDPLLLDPCRLVRQVKQFPG
jgi:hypothetical protein